MREKRPPNVCSTFELAVLGFGYNRIGAEQPWFTFSDVRQAIEHSPKHARHVEPSTVTKAVGTLVTGGYIERQVGLKLDFRRGPAPHLCCATDLAQDKLFQDLTYYVMQHAFTLSEVLIVPETVEGLMEQPAFQAHLMSAVAGL